MDSNEYSYSYSYVQLQGTDDMLCLRWSESIPGKLNSPHQIWSNQSCGRGSRVGSLKQLTLRAILIARPTFGRPANKKQKNWPRLLALFHHGGQHGQHKPIAYKATPKSQNSGFTWPIRGTPFELGSGGPTYKQAKGLPRPRRIEVMKKVPPLTGK